MSFKTIVVHCDGDKAMRRRLDIASDLATRFGSRLIGLHVRSPFQPPVCFDEGFVMNDLCKLHEDMQATERKAALEALVAVAEGSKVAVTPILVDGLVDREVIRRARCADLVVLGQTSPERSATTPPDLPELVALSSGRPVLVVPCAAVTGPIGKSLMLCWNGSREAARAASAALPFLKSADKVTVFRVRSDDPGAQRRSGRIVQ